MNSKKERSQKTIIEFICNKDKTGLEGETSPEEQYDASLFARADDKKDGEKGDGKDDEADDGKSGEETQLMKPDAALIWNSYGPADDGNTDILRLTWHTKYACEDAFRNPDNDDGDGSSSTSGWGFFTWFILLYVYQRPSSVWNMKANRAPGLSSASPPTSSLAHGSTTTATVRGAGTFCPTATPSATSRTS